MIFRLQRSCSSSSGIKKNRATVLPSAARQSLIDVSHRFRFRPSTARSSCSVSSKDSATRRSNVKRTRGFAPPRYRAPRSSARSLHFGLSNIGGGRFAFSETSFAMVPANDVISMPDLPVVFKRHDKKITSPSSHQLSALPLLLDVRSGIRLVIAPVQAERHFALFRGHRARIPRRGEDDVHDG